MTGMKQGCNFSKKKTDNYLFEQHMKMFHSSRPHGDALVSYLHLPGKSGEEK